MRPIILAGFGFEEERGSPLVTAVLLNAIPDPAWITFFRERGRYSVFDIAAATFRRNQVRIRLPRREARGVDSIRRAVHRGGEYQYGVPRAMKPSSRAPMRMPQVR
jgi:hypothetical protein